MSKTEGTHQGNKSNVPNTCAPRVKTTLTKRERRLATRIKEYETIKGTPTVFHRPGSYNK